MGSDPTHNIDACVCRDLSCIHKRASIVKSGSKIVSAFGGIGHGIARFVIRSIHDLQIGAAYIGAGELDLSLQERIWMIEEMEHSQSNQMRAVEDWIVDRLSIDKADAIYQSFSSKTTMGLEVCSLIAGGYGIVKGIMAVNKLAKIPVQATKVVRNIIKETSAINKAAKGNQLWSSNKKFTSVGNAYDHWLRHGKEFFDLHNAKQYAEKAHGLFRDPLVLKRIRSDGTLLRYNPSTNIPFVI